jgi:hypothetical protein
MRVSSVRPAAMRFVGGRRYPTDVSGWGLETVVLAKARVAKRDKDRRFVVVARDVSG